MSGNDLHFADFVRKQAGWNQTREDWRMLMELETAVCAVAREGDRRAGTVSVIRYDKDLAWIGMVLVEESFRGRGIGKTLLQWALDDCRQAGIRTVGLDATPAGRPLYEKYGFVHVADLQRWEGRLSHLSETKFEPIGEADWEMVGHLDRRVFGTDRLPLLKAVGANSRTMCARKNGRVTGFGMIRQGERAQYLGPLVAESDETALEILSDLGTLSGGGPIFWDCYDARLARELNPGKYGFQSQRPLYRMLVGEPFEQDALGQVAIVDPSAG